MFKEILSFIFREFFKNKKNINQKQEYKDSFIYYVDWCSRFWRVSSLKTVSILSSIKTINDNIFYACSSLTEISIPSSLISIGKSSFWLSLYLSKIVIPSLVKTIGDYAFSGCLPLIDATFSSVVSIGDSSLECCICL